MGRSQTSQAPEEMISLITRYLSLIITFFHLIYIFSLTVIATVNASQNCWYIVDNCSRKCLFLREKNKLCSCCCCCCCCWRCCFFNLEFFQFGVLTRLHDLFFRLKFGILILKLKLNYLLDMFVNSCHQVFKVAKTTRCLLKNVNVLHNTRKWFLNLHLIVSLKHTESVFIIQDVFHSVRTSLLNTFTVLSIRKFSWPYRIHVLFNEWEEFLYQYKSSILC